MSDEPARTTDIVDVTDCFEAVTVFRIWRNLFFVAVLASLVLLQGAFWVTDMGWVRPAGSAASDRDQAAGEGSGQSETGNPAAQVPPGQPEKAFLGITFIHVVRCIQLANGVLLVSALLYWLTQVFTLLISLVGRLGGMNHVSRAFFLSLVVLVLVIPWQYLGQSVLLGATFSVQELTRGLAEHSAGFTARTLYYLRFSGYPLVVLVLLVFAHLRSIRWAKTILRRLEII
jgi:hypothetical protein